MSKAQAVTEADFNDEVLLADKPVLVDFWAPWCQPCLQMAPIVDEVAEEMADQIKVVKVDVEENPGLSQTYAISSIPTLAIFQGGRVVHSIVGGRPKALLVKEIQSAL